MKDMENNEGSSKQDPVVKIVEEKLKPLPNLSPSCCIYQVPEKLSQINGEAYRPLVVSIGPFYHNDPHLLPMQDHKLRYMQNLLTRKNVATNSMGVYIQVIREQLKNIRDCYLHDFTNLDDDTFIEMVFLDTLFIIELFIRVYIGDDSGYKTDPIFGKGYLFTLVKRDFMLEENQLPFFILNQLYNLAFPTTPPQLIHLMGRFFIGSEGGSNIVNKIQGHEIKHFVDFLRLQYLPCNSSKSSEQQPYKYDFSPRVTDLSEAGVKFVAIDHKINQNQQLEISFDKGVLKIPKLEIDDYTESLFRNLMVYEQCHHSSETYITDYIIFFDDLIDTPKDVQILHEKGIILNRLGSNEDVMNLFNNINKHIELDDYKYRYANVSNEMNLYVKKTLHRWKATLKNKYFNHPWSIISVIYAIIMFILTLLQVITGFGKGKSGNS